MRNLNRQIARVKALLVRAQSGEELARLTSLLIMLQAERIAELERAAAPTNQRKGKVA